LVQALNEADKLETIEKNALELMQTKYDWAVIGKQTQGVYERLFHGDA